MIISEATPTALTLSNSSSSDYYSEESQDSILKELLQDTDKEFRLAVLLLNDLHNCTPGLINLLCSTVDIAWIKRVINHPLYVDKLSVIEQLPRYDIARYLKVILFLDDLAVLRFVISAAEMQNIYIDIERVSDRTQDIIQIIDKLSFALENNFTQWMIDLILYSYHAIPKFNDKIARKFLSYCDVTREQTNQLLELVEPRQLANNNSLIQWMVPLKSYSFVERYRQVLADCSNPNFRYPQLIDYFEYTINRLFIPMHLPWLLDKLEIWSQSFIIDHAAIQLFFSSLKNPNNFSINLLKLLTEHHVSKHKQGLKLYDLLKDEPQFIDNEIFNWIKKNHSKSALEMRIGLLNEIIPSVFCQTDNRNALCDIVFKPYQITKLKHFHKEFKHLVISSSVIIPLEQCWSVLLPLQQLDQYPLQFSWNDFFPEQAISLRVMKRYEQMYERSSRLHRITFDKFFELEKKTFFFLHLLFPMQKINIVEKLLDTSLTKLHDFFDILGRLLISQNYLLYFIVAQLDKIQFKNSNSIKELFDYISLFIYHSCTDFYYDNLRELLIGLTFRFKNDKDIIANFYELFAQSLLKRVSVLDSDLAHNQYSIYQMARLYFALEQHSRNAYIPVFTKLLSLHLRALPIRSFLHDQSQKNSFGQMIAANNHYNQRALMTAGVNVYRMYNYPYQRTFYVFGRERLQTSRRLINLWQLIHQLANALADPQHLIMEQKLKTRQVLNRFVKQILSKTKSAHFDLDNIEALAFMSNSANIRYLTNVLRPKLIQLLSTATLEHMKTMANLLINLIDEIKMGLDNKKTAEVDQWKKPRQFQLEVWDKTDPKTFFLGDELGCCLSTSGSMFPAIVTRIIDDALLIITVTDIQAKQIVAGFWLYLAQEKKDKKPLLIANFTEMRDAVAQDSMLRDALLSEMLDYAAQYAKALNVALLLAPQHYGTLPNWKFKSYKTEVNKIGVMSMGINFEEYYLASLKFRKFYVYTHHEASKLYASAYSKAYEKKQIIGSQGFFKPASEDNENEHTFKASRRHSV